MRIATIALLLAALGAADAAAQAGRTDLVDALFTAGLDSASASARSALVTAAISGKASVMRSLIARGVAPSPLDVTFAAWQAESNGYGAIEDLMRVKGIGQATFDKLKERIQVR